MDKRNIAGQAHKKKVLFAAGCVFLLGLAVFCRFFWLGRIPSGVFIDEAGKGYDAWCIANFGVDRFWYRLPVYFVNFGQGQDALYTYLYALILKLTGGDPELFTLRLPAAIFGVLNVACSMKLGQWSLGKKGCLLAGLITGVCPVYIMSSRWALESYLLYTMCTVCVTCLTAAIRTGNGWRKNVVFAITGLLMGITLYTYAMSYIVLPFFLLFGLGYLLYLKQISLKQIFLLGVPVALAAIPLILLLWINHTQTGAIATRFFTIPSLPEYRGGDITFSHFLMSPLPMLKSMFFNDYLGYSAYNGFYTLYIMSVPLAVVGFGVCVVRSIRAVRKKKFDVQVLILCFFAAVVLMGRFMNGEWANINQINAVFFPLWFFIVDGILWIGGKIRRLAFQRAYYGIMVGSYLVSLVFFMYTYLYKQPIRFQPLFKEGWEFIGEECDYEYCYADYGVQKIFYLFDTAPNPYEEPFDLNHQEAHGRVNCYMNDYTQIAPENVYIVTWSNEEWMNKLKESELEFQEKEFEGYTVFYKD